MTTFSPTTGGRHRAAAVQPAYPAPGPIPPAPAPAYAAPPGYRPPSPEYYVPPVMTREPMADPPALWPIIPAVALLGILGSIFARWQMRRARRLGYSTKRYWAAWGAGIAIHASIVVGISLTLNTWTQHNLRAQLAAVDFVVDGVHEHVVVNDCHSVSTTFYSGDGTYRCDVTVPDGTHQQLSAVMRARTLISLS